MEIAPAQAAAPPIPALAPPPINPSLDFFAGTVAGVASLLCGHPFDTIKVRLQCHPKQYRNAVHALLSIVKEEQFRGLYKGVLSPMLGVAAVNASVFGFYGMAMRLQLQSPTDTPSLLQITLAGTASGLFTSFLTCPIERLKILQQSAPSTAAQPTLLHLVSVSSVRSLYRGLAATALRDAAYGPYFLTYELVCRGWPGPDGRYAAKADLVEEVESGSRDVGWGRLLVAGGAAGIVGWGCTFPIDVVKSRMQASEPYLPAPEPPSIRSASMLSPSIATSRGVRPLPPSPATLGVPHPFRTTWSTIINSYRGEGVKVFTAGLGPTLLRAIPVNMVCFFVFEAVVSALR